MSWLGKSRQFTRALLVRVHHRRHDDTQDVRHDLRDVHQLLTSAASKAVLKSVQRDAPRPVRGTRETRKAVASGGEQLQQLNQPPLCDGSSHEDSFLVDTGGDLCVYRRSRLRERRAQSSYELFGTIGTTVHTYRCITLRLDFGLQREFSLRFVVGDVTGPIVG